MDRTVEQNKNAVPVLITINLLDQASKLINIQVMINGKSHDAIADSGAAVSLITAHVCKLLNLKTYSTDPMSLLCADFSRQSTNQMVKFPITFSNQTNPIELYVIEKAPFNILLGINFFTSFNISMQFKGNNVTILANSLTDLYINNILIDDIKQNARTDQEIIFHAHGQYFLQPNSETIVQTKCHDDISGYALIEVDKYLLSATGIFCCDCIVEVVNGLVMIPFTNINSFPISIKNKMKLAKTMTLEKTFDDVREVFLAKQDDEQFNINPHLDTDQKNLVKNILQKYQHLFVHDMKDLTQTSIYEHEIKLIPNYRPVYVRPFRRSEYEEIIIEQNIKELLDAKIIQPSTSPFSSPLLLVKKPDGKWRLCNDYRQLNKITVRDVYLLPRQSTVLSELSGHNWFSQCDLFSGYYQVPLTPESRKYTAFLTSNNLYEYRVLPFGCMNGGSCFSRVISLAFQTMKKDCLTWYIDDLAILGFDFNHHMSNIEKVLSRIEKINMKLKPSKCFFAMNKIKFLGYEIEQGKIKPDPDRIKPITEMREPKNAKEVQVYLGAINFYRKYILNHSIIAAPLYNLIKKDTKFIWDQHCQSAFDHFKNVLTNPPILRLFNEKHAIFLQSDACQQGFGGIIMQKDDDGQEYVVEYHSRSSNDCEKRYSATELELAGVIFIVSKARCYVFGRHFTIYCDHKCLQYLNNLKSSFGKLGRWYHYLQEFDFEILHRPGKNSANVDMLSRLSLPYTISTTQDTDLDTRSIFLMDINHENILSQDTIREAQKNDEFCSRIKNHQDMGKRGKYSTYVVKEGILMKQVHSFMESKELIVVPISLMDRLINIFHDQSTHSMALKTYLKIKTRFFHPNLFKYVNKYCKSCIKCQKRNPLTTLQPGTSDLMPTSHVPWEGISIDLMGPFPKTLNGNQYILVIIDICSRYVVCVPIADKTMTSVAKGLIENVFHVFGFCKYVTSDQGKEFCNKLFKEITDIFKIDHRTTTAYHPNSNGIVERANKNLGAAIAKQVNSKHSDWDEYLKSIAFGFNSSVHSITRKVPLEILLATKVSFPTDVLIPTSSMILKKQNETIEKIRKEAENNVKVQQIKSQELRNEKLNEEKFERGEKCLIKRQFFKEGLSRKFLDKYTGPHTIIDILKDGLYKIKNEQNGKEQVVNLNHMKKYHERERNETNDTHDEGEKLKDNWKEFNDENIDENDSISTIEVSTKIVQGRELDQLPIPGPGKESERESEQNFASDYQVHQSLPNLLDQSFESEYLDAMSELSSNERNTNETPVRISSRARKEPDRLQIDFGTSQSKRGNGRGRGHRRGTR